MILEYGGKITGVGVLDRASLAGYLGNAWHTMHVRFVAEECANEFPVPQNRFSLAKRINPNKKFGSLRLGVKSMGRPSNKLFA